MKPRISIHAKLFAVTIVVLSVVLAGGFYFILRFQSERVRDTLARNTASLSEVLASTAGNVVAKMADARRVLDAVSAGLINSGDLLGVEVHSPIIGIISNATSPGFGFAAPELLAAGISSAYRDGRIASMRDGGVYYRFVPISGDGAPEGVAVFASASVIRDGALTAMVGEGLGHIYSAEVHGGLLYLQRLASEIGTLEGVRGVLICDSGGNVLAASKGMRRDVVEFDPMPYIREALSNRRAIAVEAPAGDLIFRPIPAAAGPGIDGVIGLQSDLSAARRDTAYLRYDMLAAWAVTLAALSAIIGLMVRKLILQPVKGLVKLTEAVASGDLRGRAALNTGDEFEVLGDSFNRMLGDIERSHDELTASRDFLERILAHMNEAVLVFTSGGIVWASNASAQSISGYGKEELDSLGFREIFSGFPGDGGKDIAELCDGREMTLKRRDGVLVPVAVSCASMEDDGQVFVLQDISGRKKAEEALRASEEKFSKAFLASPDLILISRLSDGRIIDCNESVLNSLGYEKGEVLGRTTEEAGFWKGQSASRDEFVGRIVHEGRAREFEMLFDVRGEPRTLLVSSEPISVGGEDCLLSVAHDVTERKRAEARLRAAISEKEVLLREVHHRVKNNLQVIQSMLSMQAMHIKDTATERAFRESQGRVRSMALIHERFYRSGDLSRIDFGEYTTSLLRQLFSIYGADPGRIATRVEAGGVSLPIDYAIPCGIIINEIVSNSLKYAFPDGRPGEIFVVLQRPAEGRVSLSIGDDGAGIPGGPDLSGMKSLGLHLVRILAEDQLEGALSVSAGGENGVVFRVEFAVT